MTSLRRQLLVALLVALSLTLLIGAYVSYRLAREEADESFDYQLRQIAMAQRGGDFRDAMVPDDPEEEADFVVQVFAANGARVYLSDPRSKLPKPLNLGFDDLKYGNEAWRAYAIANRGRVIEVAQPLSSRDELAATAALRAVAPFMALLPVIGLLVWFIVGRGLAALSRLADWVGQRSSADLAPLPEQGTPQEVLPLIHALNSLLARLGKSLEAQRTFVADAAHELRTPLTALTLQAQLIERAKDANERSESLADLKAGLHRATHVVAQLLTLARSEPGGDERPFCTVHLADLASSVSSRYLVLAETKGVDLGIVSEDPKAVVSGDPSALATLLANLLENAIRYTPGGGRIDISTGMAADGPWLEVADTGPGIPPDQRERVFDRFYRQVGATESGTGLGLAIVKAIAERHKATVTLGDAPNNGLRVRLAFSGNLRRIGR